MSKNIFDFFLSKEFLGPIVIIIGAILLKRIAVLILSKATIGGKTELEKKRRMTIISLIENIVKYTITIIAGVMILNIYGVNTTSIVAGLGIAGVVIGLALQDALKDIIGGINIIMDDYYVVGDIVKYGTTEGVVTYLGLKTTKIKPGTGEVLIVANRNINAITNYSQKQAVLFFEIPTSTETKIDKVKTVLEDLIDEICNEFEYVERNESGFLGVDKITSGSILYTFKIKCVQGKEKALKRIINVKIKDTYDKNKIKLAD